MSKVKTVTCLLTGDEMPKKKTVCINGHRVNKKLEHVGKGILIDGAKVFQENWCNHSKSSINRLKTLATAICVIKQCQEIFFIDPMVFIVEIVRLCQESNDPISMTFTQKLVDYTNGIECSELNKPNVKRAIREGFNILKNAVSEENRIQLKANWWKDSPPGPAPQSVKELRCCV